MTPIKRNISYQFKDSWLRMQIRWAGSHRLLVWCGFEIDKTDSRGRPKWDGARCRQNTTHGVNKVPASIINGALDNLEQRVADIFYSYEMRDEIPVPKDIKCRLNDNNVKSISLKDAFQAFISYGETQKGWAFNTVKSVKNIESLLMKFRPNLRYDDIDKALLEEFVVYMQTNRVSSNTFKSGQKGYSNATIVKHSRTLRWFLSWSSQQGYISESVWKHFSPSVKTVRQPVVFLEWDELMRLEAAEFQPGSEIERAKDFFLFCCFTGLRYSDAAALKKNAVRDDYFEVVSIKTSTPLKIEFNSHSKRIINKYKDSEGDNALPSITNNRLNHLLKDIGEVLDINATVLSTQFYGANKVEREVPKYERLSSHCARRTFICNALALGIAPHIVMKWTGHSEYTSMKPYIEVANKLKEESMKRFDSPDGYMGRADNETHDPRMPS